MKESFSAKPLERKETAEVAQEWLNSRKEEAHLKQVEIWKDILESKGEDGVRNLFLTLINERLTNDGRQALPPGLVKNLSYQEVVSASASEVAGIKITRSVFIFEDVKSFQNFYGAIDGMEESHWDKISARGFVTAFDINMPDGKSERVSLIVAPRGNDEISHEVRHTIDPYLDERKGYDRVLCEFFAYYTQILEAAYRNNRLGRIWNDLNASAWGAESSYYSEYSKDTENPISFKEYGALVQQVTEKFNP